MSVPKRSEMNILLTGAGGFIAPYLARMFVADGHVVTCPVRRQADLSDTIAGVRILEADLAKPFAFDRDYDVIVHCAGTAPVSGRGDAALVADNLDSTRRLAEAACSRPPRAFMFFSSMSVYGTAASDVIDEATPAVAPSLYGMSKLLAEDVLEGCSATFPSVILRLPAILGPGVRGHWLANALARAERDEPIEIFHPDAPFNNAVFYDDLVVFVRALAGGAHRGCERLVLSLDGFLPIAQTVERLVRAAASRSTIVVTPSPQRSFVIDASRARRLHGFGSRSVDAAIDGFGRFAARAQALTP